MDIGIYATTHGIGYRDENDFFLKSASPHEMRPVRIAQLAEAAGFHSMWFPDHVCMPTGSSSAHVANASGKRAYEARHNMLDAAVTMGAVASGTSTLKLGTSVLIVPYQESAQRRAAVRDHRSALRRPSDAWGWRRLDEGGVRCPWPAVR